jgi:energy-coupling factor transport system permease protein
MAWWIWAFALAAAVSHTTNPILLVLVLGVLDFVVANRRSEAPWARAFKYYLFLALTVIAIRVVFRSVFGGDVNVAGTVVLFRLPDIPLPSWASGVQLGGPVTLDGTLAALYQGLQLGTLLCCLGAANTLANPKRALRVLPCALYELGVAVVVALSVAPQLVESLQRVRRARKLRGGAAKGFHALRSIAIPILEDALDRSLRLAAAMDSRGYGRTAGASPKNRRITGAFMLAGLAGLCIGAYGLLNGWALKASATPAFGAGAFLCAVGFFLGGRQVLRSQYRPDRWTAPEWIVCLSGIIPAVVLIAGVGSPAIGLNPPTDPLAWPTLPLLPALALLVGAVAAVAAPPPLRATPPPVVGPPSAPLAAEPIPSSSRSDGRSTPDGRRPTRRRDRVPT